jgi:oligopeptide transport system permease protein
MLHVGAPDFLDNAEASLSSLGIGIRQPTASWGSMVFLSCPIVTYLPVFVILPSALIALIMIAFAFVGDGLRDALDPQSDKHCRPGPDAFGRGCIR